MSLSQCHYDKPQSHNTTQTRWVLPAGKKIFAASVKILDLRITPNQDAYFPALVGAYAALKRVQLSLNGRVVDIWNAQSVLPLLVASSGDNEKQKGINRALYGSGNNIYYDEVSKLLSFDRPIVEKSNPLVSSVKLGAYCDLLNNIGIINDTLEIICDWEKNPKNIFCPADPNSPVTSFTIDAPYLSYETFIGDFKQGNNVPFRMWVEDKFSVPAIGTSNTPQRYEIRSNAFNNRTLGRLLLVNTPNSIDALAPFTDCTQLFQIFGKYMSVPMKQENFNVARDGRLIFSLRNVNNDSAKLAVTKDCWGDLCLVTGGHYHANESVLNELQGAPLNGFCSYGAVEINSHVSKELQMSYSRVSDVNGTYPSLGSDLTLSAVAEVKCMLVDGHKIYI